MMKRFPLPTLAVSAAVAVSAAAVVVSPSAASAKIVELGQTSTPIASPSCPKGVKPVDCFIVLTRTTAVQSVSDSVIYPTTVKRAGWIVAFTVGLSKLSSNASTERSFLRQLDTNFGGTPQVALTVLQPGPKQRFTVVAQSAVYHLIPFLGQVLQEPLSLPPAFSALTALPVKPGEVIGLSVPTWAPVLSYNLNATKFAYRQSRSANCRNAAAGETAQTTIGAGVRYRCNYPGTRVQYSATEIINQPYPKSYVHSRRRR